MLVYSLLLGFFNAWFHYRYRYKLIFTIKTIFAYHWHQRRMEQKIHWKAIKTFRIRSEQGHHYRNYNVYEKHALKSTQVHVISQVNVHLHRSQNASQPNKEWILILCSCANCDGTFAVAQIFCCVFYYNILHFLWLQRKVSNKGSTEYKKRFA